MTDEQIARARKLRDEGLSYREIGEILGVSLSTAHYALNPEAKERRRLYREKHKEEAASYHRTNKKILNEKSRIRSEEWRKTHKERKHLYDTEYREAHKEEIRLYNQTYSAKYSADHREEARLRYVEYYKLHKDDEAFRERKRVCSAKYREEHRAECIARANIRRALLAGAFVGASAEQKAEIAEIYRRAKEDKKVRCYLCGKLIPKGHRHIDHITPLSKGGAHRPSNLAVACDRCNLRKHDKMPGEVGVLL